MRQYRNLVAEILTQGTPRTNRTGISTLSIFGHQSRYSLFDSFPLLTLKKTHWKSICHELLWFLSGDTNVKYLNDKGVTIWDDWANEDGELGPVYGSQWRRWGDSSGSYDYPIDQIVALIDGIGENPDSRRHIVTAWNPADIDKMALPPCHCFFQCNVRAPFIDLQLYQRSADVFLGVPFNIASYAALLCMIAQVTGYKPGHFIHTLGDAHIYENHMPQAYEMLKRMDRPLPKLELNPFVKDIFDFKFEDFSIVGYDPHPTIKAEVAV